MPRKDLIKCHECDLLQVNPLLPSGGASLCSRCGATLHRDRPDSLNRTLALTLAGIILFIVANSFPFLSFQMQEQVTQTTLFTGVKNLYLEGMWGLAAIVFFTSILAPGLQLLLLLTVLLPLALMKRLPPGFGQLFRWVKTLAPWGMMDVFMLGILVSVVKLSDMAIILPGTSLFAFVVLIFVLAAAQASLDPDIVWDRIPVSDSVWQSIRGPGPLLSCHVCDLTLAQSAANDLHGHHRCPRCGETLHWRKPHSIQRSWALIIAATAFYVPANLFPIMSVTSLGNTQSDTILSGVIFLLQHGMWPLALIVFIASVFVPLMKLLILIYLLVSVQMRSARHPRDRTRLYRITEAIGRWSMVDIYVVTILVALVRLGNLASIQAEVGAVFFGAVVVLTMFAAMSFDPRLIWDAMEQGYDRDGRQPGPSN